MSDGPLADRAGACSARSLASSASGSYSRAGSLAEIIEDLARLLANLEVAALPAAEAADAVLLFVRGENLCATGKAVCAQRATQAGEHRRSGHQDPASWLAERSGDSRGRARDALEMAASLEQLPELEGAVRSGELSPTRARVVAEAATVEPAAEGRLLAAARSSSLGELREEADAVKASARSALEEAERYEAIRKARHLRTFTTRDGAFRGQFSLTPDAGAKVLAVLQPASDIFFADARRAGRREPNEAYLADAFVAVVTGTWPVGATAQAETETESGPEEEDVEEEDLDGTTEFAGFPGDGLDGIGTAHESGPAGRATCLPGKGGTPDAVEAGCSPGLKAAATRPLLPDEAGGSASLAPRRRRPIPGGTAPPSPPRATVICRVDLAALRRGDLHDGETCEIPGVGPVPLTVALDLFGDCFLKFVISDGIDPRTVVHYGRTIPAPLRTALEFRDRCCVVPGCGRTFGLEFDHIVEFAKGGPASLQNLCRLCGFHHHLKTHKGYRIRGGPGRWEWLPPHERPADEFESSVAVRSNAAATPAGKSTQPTSPVQLTEPAVGPSVDRLF